MEIDEKEYYELLRSYKNLMWELIPMAERWLNRARTEPFTANNFSQEQAVIDGAKILSDYTEI